MERALPILLPDAPRAELGEAAPFRQAALRDHLMALAKRHLDTRGISEFSPFVALLGRYGQGKSSVIKAVEKGLLQHAPVRSAFIHLVDVAVIPPDTLSAAFERLILPRMFLLRAARAMLIPLAVTFLALLAYRAMDATSPPPARPAGSTATVPAAGPTSPTAPSGGTGGGSTQSPQSVPASGQGTAPAAGSPAASTNIPAAPPGSPPLGWSAAWSWQGVTIPLGQAMAILLALTGLFLGVAPLTQAMAPFFALIHTGPPGTSRQLWRLIWRGAPDLLLVDNLDRVTAEQQRALLRAIHRARGWLNRTMVIVALDQGRLVDSSPDPETGPELLRKVFDLQLQMPPMTRQDACAITRTTFAETRTVHDSKDPRNDSDRGASWEWLHRLIDNPMVQGDFARIVLLHRRHSQRFPRRLLNNALAAAHLIDACTPTEFCALLRLQGLFEHLPALQHDPKAIAGLMRTDDANGLIAHAERHLGKSIPGEVAVAVREFVDETRHIHPDFADWENFTAWLGGRTAAIRNNTQAVSIWSLAWAQSVGPAAIAKVAADWCDTDLALAEERGAPERLRLLRAVFASLGDTTSDTESKGADRTAKEGYAPVRNAQAAEWVLRSLLLHRLWLADGAAQGLMLGTDRTALLHLDRAPHRMTIETAFPQAGRDALGAVYGDFIRLLPNAPRGSHGLAQAALFTAHRHSGHRPEGKALLHWFAATVPTTGRDPLRDMIAGDTERIYPRRDAPVRASWPRPQGFAEAQAHVRIARVLRPFGCRVPLDDVADLLTETIQTETAGGEAQEGVLRTLVASCPEIQRDLQVGEAWDGETARELFRLIVPHLSRRSSAGSDPARVLHRALIARGEAGAPAEARFFLLLLLIEEQRVAFDSVHDEWIDGLDDVARRIRPAVADWDLSFVAGLLAVDEQVWLELPGSSRATLRSRLQALPSALAEAGPIEENLAFRIAAWLKSQ